MYPPLAHPHRLDRQPAHQPLAFDMMIVTRRVSAGSVQIAELFDDPHRLATRLPDGSTLAMGPMVRGSSLGGTTWRGHASIRRPGLPLLPPVRIDVELSSWSDDSGEVRLSPTSRHFRWWGARRLRRYFASAHAAADHLWRALRGPAPTDLPTDAPAPAASLDAAA